MTAKKPLLKMLLLAFGFGFCAAIGIFLYASTNEEWLLAIGIGVGFIVFSAIGFYIDMKKPKFLEWASFLFQASRTRACLVLGYGLSCSTKCLAVVAQPLFFLMKLSCRRSLLN
jgi:hypothetical protein